MRKRRNSFTPIKSGFTLVELLVVMGVLAVLVVTILVSLNPSEAGKKSRDVKRMKDLKTLEAIIVQYIQDGGVPFCTGRCESINNSGKTDCADNWIRYADGSAVNLCNYTKTVPVDPLNGKSATVWSVCTSPPTPRVDMMRYLLKMQGSDYEILEMQESKSNTGNLAQSGSAFDCNWVDIASSGRIW